MGDLKIDVRDRVLTIQNLPTLPRVYEEINRLLDDPLSGPEQIAALISQDQALTVKVLRMVNSPVYGFPRRICSIEHAMVLLGLGVVRGLIVSVSVMDDMIASMEGLWQHSLACAAACDALARHAGLKNPEAFGVCGLLHDLGKVVVALQAPDLRDEIAGEVRRADMAYVTAEKQVLGFSHDRINAWLADHWNLPGAIKSGMSCHHAESFDFPDGEYGAVTHIGDFLARVFEIGWAGDDRAPKLERGALDRLGLGLSDLRPVMDSLCAKTADLSA